MIGASLASFLPPKHVEAIRAACVILIDNFFDDIEELSDDNYSFADTFMSFHLPERNLPRYTRGFARQFLVSVVAVTGKLFSENDEMLSCTAEELALNAIIDMAGSVLETHEDDESAPDGSLENSEDEDGDIDALFDVAFQDTDFEHLFDDSNDGIEDSPIGERLGIGRLRFEDWFEKFDNTGPVHPYPADGSGEMASDS